LIAASCSGVNFLITAFLMLALARLWKCRSQAVSWSFIPLSLLFSYLTTIAANTVRISPRYSFGVPTPTDLAESEELHRFEGILVYFGFLLLLFLVSEKFGSGAKPRTDGTFGLVKRSLLPLAVYYATTLGVPLLNGAFRRGPRRRILAAFGFCNSHPNTSAGHSRHSEFFRNQRSMPGCPRDIATRGKMPAFRRSLYSKKTPAKPKIAGKFRHSVSRLLQA